MNASLLRRIFPRPRLLGLTLGSVLAVAVSCFAQDAGAASDPFAAAPEGAAREALDAGKVAEEGDHDLDQATREYQAVIASYDALRPRAAEALFRLGEIAARRQQTNEARSLFARVVEEFPTVGEYGRQSQDRLSVLLSVLGPGQTVYAMDPALAQRYGLNPQNTPAGMDPAMARRYGLMVGGSPPAAGAGGGIGGTVGTGFGASAAQSQGPGGSGFGGGGGMAPGTFGTTAPSASPYTVNITGGSSDKAATLRAEAAQIAAQLRKLRRERRALENPDLRHLPMALVEDPQVIKLMESCDRARLNMIMFEASLVGPDGTRKASDENGVRNAQQLLLAEENAQRILTSYLSGTCLPRMQRAEELLSRELDELELEIRKAAPKF